MFSFHALFPLSGINHHLEHPRWVFLFLFYASWLRGFRLLQSEPGPTRPWQWYQSSLRLKFLRINSVLPMYPNPEDFDVLPTSRQKDILSTRSPSEFPLRTGWGLVNSSFHILWGLKNGVGPYHFVDNTVG